MREHVGLRREWRWPPIPSRVPERNLERLRRLHEEASTSGNNVYVDPLTGLTVFTADFLAARAYCCDSGCRHCPYEPET